ncbi:ParB/RepB/Spo0J family partition protein [Clostridium sp. DL1XJH146]
MVKKHGLGKGLGALIPEEMEENVDGISKISINLIRANKEQPRKNFDEEKIMVLAESIKQHGVIQPVILKKEKNMYVIVAGERRWRASKIAGLKELPAVVIETSEKELLEISLIENIQREDLNPIEEAEAYTKLIEEFELTQEDLSGRIGKSRSAITNILRLLNLDYRVRDYIIDAVISEGHGRALLAISNGEMQYNIAQKIIDEKLSVRSTEKLIKDLKNKNNDEKVKNNIYLEPYYKDIKVKLEDYFDTKVQIKEKGKNKGKIEIDYYSEGDLQRILDILKI